MPVRAHLGLDETSWQERIEALETIGLELDTQEARFATRADF